MDFADLGSEREELDREISLAAQRAHAPDLPPTGACYNCDQPLPDGVRFCDCECRNDYELRARMEAQRP